MASIALPPLDDCRYHSTKLSPSPLPLDAAIELKVEGASLLAMNAARNTAGAKNGTIGVAVGSKR